MQEILIYNEKTFKSDIFIILNNESYAGLMLDLIIVLTDSNINKRDEVLQLATEYAKPHDDVDVDIVITTAYKIRGY